MTTTIDITPSWAAVTPILIAAIENGTGQGRRAAQEEVRRMAKSLDAHNELLRKVEQYDAELNSKEESPTGDDYNELVSLLGIAPVEEKQP